MAKILEQLPLDAEQRASIIANLAATDESIVTELFYELEKTLGLLDQTVKEIE